MTPTGISASFATGIDLIKVDVLDYVSAALPVALIIVGTFLAIKLGIKFFKSVAK
ncbi:MAG: hypothetical protein JJE17_12140 [Peptostreptococcaceae bacterium]|nr:hypothetical protein [Peptostreptococcaceae bacterium]